MVRLLREVGGRLLEVSEQMRVYISLPQLSPRGEWCVISLGVVKHPITGKGVLHRAACVLPDEAGTTRLLEGPGQARHTRTHHHTQRPVEVQSDWEKPETMISLRFHNSSTLQHIKIK